LRRSLSAELNPLLRDQLGALALATGLGLIVAVALSLFSARALAAPVARLAGATREIGTGHYDHRVEITSNDELGQLGRAFNDMAAGLKQRVFFESALRRYLAGPVVEELIRDPSRLRLGGEKREVTVLFFDVAGFTPLAEQMAPDELVAFVNQYSDMLVEAVFRNGGTLDKFIGDAVMAYFGAPIEQPDHAARACKAAVDMQRAIAEFAARSTDKRMRGLSGRVGVHTGMAVLGNMGSTHFMNYTVMGDTVNLASRLVNLNKLYRTPTMATESTIGLAGSAGASRELDRVRVKGRAEPVRIFELFGEGSAPPPDALVAYGEGLVHYRERRFLEAQKAFKRARARGDGACADVMAERCVALAAQGPPPDWDAVHNVLEK
jgi:adenylate cyclase